MRFKGLIQTHVNIRALHYRLKMILTPNARFPQSPSLFRYDPYTLPVIAANPFGIWRNQFYWFLSHLREGSGCAFCSLILQTLNLSHEVENLESGFITARREALYSKEKETSRPNLYSLPWRSQSDD